MIRSILLVLVFFCAFPSFSSENKQSFIDKEEAKTVTIYESSQDLANRMVLAFFGKDALQAFETRKVVGIEDMEKEEIQRIVKPFVYIYPYFAPVLLIWLNIAMMILIIGLITIVLYSIIVSKDGEFLGNEWSASGTTLKVLLSVILIMPISGEVTEQNSLENAKKAVNLQSEENVYSVGQYMLFKVAGYSNSVGRAFNKDVIGTSTQYYPTVRLAKDDSKLFLGTSLINYQLCLKQYDISSPEMILDGKDDGFSIEVHSDNFRCPFSFTVKLDAENYEYARNTEQLEQQAETYLEMQKNSVRNAIESSLNLADKAANILIKEYNLIDDPYKNRRGELLDVYTENNTNKDFVIKWQKNCDSIFNFQPSRGLNDIEKIQYAFLASRCISYNINNKIVFDKKGKEELFDSEFSNSNIELCTNESIDNKVFNGRTIIDNEVILNEINYDFKQKTKKLDQCIKETCVVGGSAYLCGNTISLHKKYKKDIEYSNYGVFALGATSNLMFSQFNSESSKVVYNSLNIVNDVDASKVITSGNFSFDFKSTGSNRNLEEYFIDERDISSVENDFFNIRDGVNGINVLGVERFFTCLQSPLMITQEYVCNSVIEEYSILGKTLMNTYLQVQTAKHIMQVIKGKPTYYSKSQSGSITQKKNVIKDKVKTVFVSTAIGTMIFGNHFDVINKVLGYGDPVQDEFGYITSKDKYSFSDSSKTAFGMLVGLSLYGGDVLNTFIDLLFILAIITMLIVPLTPFILFLFLLIQWLSLFLSTLFQIHLWSIFMLKPSKDETNPMIYMGLNIFFITFIQIPFLSFGLLYSYYVNNVIVSVVSELLDFSSKFKGISFEGGMIDALITIIITMCVNVIVTLIVVNLTLSIIQTLYDFAVRFIGGDLEDYNAGQDVTAVARGELKSTVHSVKNK